MKNKLKSFLIFFIFCSCLIFAKSASFAEVADLSDLKSPTYENLEDKNANKNLKKFLILILALTCGGCFLYTLFLYRKKSSGTIGENFSAENNEVKNDLSTPESVDAAVVAFLKKIK